MDPAVVFVLVVVALAVGGMAAKALTRGGSRDQRALVAALRAELEQQRRETEDRLSEVHRRDLQGALDTLLRVAGEQLDARVRSGASHLDQRKELIDAELAAMGHTLGEVADLVQRLESERANQLGRVTEQLQVVTRGQGELAQTTGALKAALSASPSRGQWGERLAVDVLTAAGFVEGVNFVTQATTPGGSRPDITFLLPGDQVLHLDVKFPLDNYLAMVEADGDTDREARRTAFLRDVRARVKELARRDYVDPSAGTLDCVLLFLPNEAVYGFVLEHDPGLLDDALGQKVVLCSPSTLFGVLAVIRQAVDSFTLERTSDEILRLLAGFADQWGRFTEAMDKVGRNLETTQRAFDALSGTRRNQLERQLDAIERLRTERDVGATLASPTPRLVPLDHGDDEQVPGVEDGTVDRDGRAVGS